MPHSNFKEFILQEGDIWDAMKHGVKQGIAAYRDVRNKQTKVEKKTKLFDQLMLAKSEAEIKAVVRNIVANGCTISDGKLVDKPEAENMNRWLTKESVKI